MRAVHEKQRASSSRTVTASTPACARVDTHSPDTVSAAVAPAVMSRMDRRRVMVSVLVCSTGVLLVINGSVKKWPRDWRADG